MRLLPFLPILLVAVTACQTEVFPDAPSVPTKNPVASTPTGNLPFAPPHDRGQLVATHGRYLEFVSATSSNNGRVFFAFYLYDAKQVSIASASQATGTMQLNALSGSPSTKTLQFYVPSTNEDPFLWTFPDLAAGQTYQVHADLTIDGSAYSGDFTYQPN